MMRRSIGILAGFTLAMLIVAGDARAQENFIDSGLYFSVGGGVSDGEFLENQWTRKRVNPDTTVTTFDFDVDYALTGVAAVGYAWAPEDSPVGFRVEIEGSYRRAEIDVQIVSTSALFGVPVQTIFDAEGYLQTVGAMLNGYVDLPVGPITTPYIGAGIGLVQTSRKDMLIDGAPVADQTVHAGAWQAMTGVGFKLSPGTIVGFELRYFEIQGFRFDLELQDNNVNFGEFMLTFRLVG